MSATTDSRHVHICDVGLRDGLQNEAERVSTGDKLAILGALRQAGLREFEIGSFVRPDRVPQMADTDQLFHEVATDREHRYMGLVPNMAGYRRAAAAGAGKIALVLAATDTLNERNIGMSTARALEVARAVIEAAKGDGVIVRAYVAAACGCPYEGDVAAGRVRELAGRLLADGADEVCIADTIGAGNPAEAGALFRSLVEEHGGERLVVHLHDTRALGLALAWTAVQAGFRRFDSSIAGLGGCPFAPGASGNLATEDLVLMLHQCGFRTGVDQDALVEAVDLVEGILGRPVGGRMLPWWRSRKATQQNGGKPCPA